MSPQTIVFTGRSGCGKGTQVKLLDAFLRKQDAQKRQIFYIETGAGFREFIKGNSHTSKLAKGINDHGGRQPDYLAVWMWSHQFVEKLTGEEHLIIDGTPRSLTESIVLDNAFEFYKRRANIIHLKVSRQASEQRLFARGRVDDLDARKVGNRLDWFDRDVQPAIEYFRKLPTHNFIEVDGEQTVERVHADILAALKTD